MTPRRIALCVWLWLLHTASCGGKTGLNAPAGLEVDAGESHPALGDAAPDIGADAAPAPTACAGLVSAACVSHPDGPSYAFVGLDLDFDEDCVPDGADDCPARRNTDQVDADGDRLGDACDQCAGPDEDRDGFCDADDVCPHNWDPSQIDIDGDRRGDACDTQSCFSPLGPSEKQRYLSMLVRHTEFADLVAGVRWRMASASANCTSNRALSVGFKIYDYDGRRIISAFLNTADDTLVTRVQSGLDGAAQVSGPEAYEATELARADAVVEQRLSGIQGKIETIAGYFQHPKDARFASCAEGRCVEVEFSRIAGTAIVRLFNAIVDLKACRVLGVV